MILLLQVLEKCCTGACSDFLRFRSRNCWRSDIRNFGAWVFFRKEKRLLSRLAFDVMFGTWGKSMGACWIGVLAAVTVARADIGAPEFRFDRDTFAFANQTVFEYHDGHASLRKASATKKDAYNRHCFVMSRTAMQFNKFARFEPRSTPFDDVSLAARIRDLTRQSAWSEPLPEN